MQRKDLLSFLIKEKEEAKEQNYHLFSSGYHDSDSIYDCIHTLLSEYGDAEDDIDDIDDIVDDLSEIIDDIVDDLSEICDSQTPIYYADIAEWFTSNWYAVNKYVEEIGIDSKDFDIMRIIQGAYCYTLENETRAELEEFIDYYNDKKDTDGTEHFHKQEASI